MTEEVEVGEQFYICSEAFPRDRYHTEYFDGVPVVAEYKREEFKVRMIANEKAISALSPKEYIDKEMNHWGMKGFSYTRRDPYAIFMRKEKRFVIADSDINSAFDDVEDYNEKTDFERKSLNLLIIEMTKDINILRSQLQSKKEIVGNYRYENKQLENEIKYLKSRNLFQRIFKWGKK